MKNLTAEQKAKKAAYNKAYAAKKKAKVQDKLTPTRVLQVLKDGNERFVSGRRLQRDLIRQVDATSGGRTNRQRSQKGF